jgi:phage protein D
VEAQRMSIAARTYLEITYNGVDISRDISNDLVSFQFTDNESGKADDISIGLKDDDGLWSGAWTPGQGDTIEATIVTENDDQGVLRLALGKFTIDEFTSSGTPSVFEIAAVSVPIDGSIRREIKSRAWEDYKLSGIADDIARNGGIEMLFLASPDPVYDRRDQHDETDLQFLNRLCEDEAFALKVTDRQLIVYNSAQQENYPPVATIYKRTGDVLGYSFKAQSHSVYKAVTVRYKDQDTGKVNEYRYESESAEGNREFKVYQRAKNIAEAERLAKAALRQKNRKGTEATLKMRGSVDLVTGVPVELVGFGYFDGVYLIKKATHTVGNGYEVDLELTRKVEV